MSINMSINGSISNNYWNKQISFAQRSCAKQLAYCDRAFNGNDAFKMKVRSIFPKDIKEREAFENEIFERYKANPNSKKAKEDFVLVLLPCVMNLAEKWASQGVVDEEDMESDATLKIWKLIENKKIDLTLTLAQIKTNVSIASNQEMGASAIEEQAYQETCLKADIEKKIYKKKIESENGELSNKEMAKKLGVSESTLKKAQARSALPKLSLDFVLKDDSDNTAMDLTYNPDQLSADDLLKVKQISDLAKRVATKQELEAFNIHNSEEITFENLGKRIGVSREQARLLNLSVNAKVRVAMHDDKPVDYAVLEKYSKQDFVDALRRHINKPILANRQSEKYVLEQRFLKGKYRSEIVKGKKYTVDKIKTLEDNGLKKVLIDIANDLQIPELNLKTLKKALNQKNEEKILYDVLEKKTRQDFIKAIGNHINSPKLTEQERDVLEQRFCKKEKKSTRTIAKENNDSRVNIKRLQHKGIKKLLPDIAEDLQVSELNFETVKHVLSSQKEASFDILKQYSRKEAIDALQNQLKTTKLGKNQKFVIQKIFFEDQSLAQIAGELNLKPGTIKTHQNRALTKLLPGIAKELNIPEDKLDIFTLKVLLKQKEAVNNKVSSSILKEYKKEEFHKSLANHIRFPELTKEERDVLNRRFLEEPPEAQARIAAQYNYSQSFIFKIEERGLTKLLPLIEKDLVIPKGTLDVKTLKTALSQKEKKVKKVSKEISYDILGKHTKKAFVKSLTNHLEYPELTAEEKGILKRRFPLYKKPETKEQIAAHYKCSRARIFKVEEKGLTKLLPDIEKDLLIPKGTLNVKTLRAALNQKD